MAQQVLKEEDLTRINEGLAALKEADEILQLAKQAGINVGQRETTHREAQDRLLRLKQTFFPGR